MSRRHIPDSTKKAIAADYALGVQAKVIAHRCGVAVNSVFRIAKAMGCEMRRKRPGGCLTPAIREAIIADVTNGLSLSAAAKRNGVHFTTIWRVKRRELAACRTG